MKGATPALRDAVDDVLRPGGGVAVALPGGGVAVIPAPTATGAAVPGAISSAELAGTIALSTGLGGPLGPDNTPVPNEPTGPGPEEAPQGKTWQDFLPEAQRRLDATKAKYGNIDARMSAIPGNPFTGPNAPQQAYKHLQKYHGVDPTVASNRLHKIKQQAGLGAADDVAIGRTGDVYNAATGERLGSLTDKTLGQ